MLVKSLFAYMRSYKKECILGPLFKLLEATFELLVPLVMAAVIDVGIARADRGYVGRMCLVMAGLGVVGLVCSITAQFFAAKASVGIAAKLRHTLVRPHPDLELHRDGHRGHLHPYHPHDQRHQPGAERA